MLVFFYIDLGELLNIESMNFIISLAIVIAYYYYFQKKLSEKKGMLQTRGIDLFTITSIGKYIGGHPDLDSQIDKVSIAKKINELVLINDMEKFPSLVRDNGIILSIPIDKINNVLVEDKSIMSKRVTATRLLLTGIFAFAWKKNTKDEFAYIVIEWNDDRFSHETIFEFSKKGAIEKANATRNKILKLLK